MPYGGVSCFGHRARLGSRQHTEALALAHSSHPRISWPLQRKCTGDDNSKAVRGGWSLQQLPKMSYLYKTTSFINVLFLPHKNNNNASLLLNLSLLSVRRIKIGETGIKTFFCIQVKEYKIGNMVMPPHEQMWTEKKVLYTYNDGADSQRFFASS